MIRVQDSDTTFRWIMPYRIISVTEFTWQDKNIHGEAIAWDPWLGRHVLFSGGHSGAEHTTPPRSTILYQGGDEKNPDHLRVKETPKQIAEMVRAAMPMVSIGSKT